MLLEFSSLDSTAGRCIIQIKMIFIWLNIVFKEHDQREFELDVNKKV